MLKILSAEQIKAADAYTIKHEPIASIDLMERASNIFCDWFCEKFTNKNKTVYVFCGTGNNGGDGLAISRLLQEEGFCVKTFVVRYSKSESKDFIINFESLKGIKNFFLREIESEKDFPETESDSYIIDALIGSGLNKPLDGLAEQLVLWLNNINAIKIAVDIPSGLYADKKSAGEIFKADYTFSFELPKLSFLLPENFPYVGEFEFRSIGLSKQFIDEPKTNHYYITKEFISTLIKPRRKFDHKGTYGHALIVGGSYGKIGAVQLAARAALHAGCGLVTVYIPKCGYEIIQTSFPEAMVITDKKEDYISKIKTDIKFSSLGIGPGIGKDEKTAEALFEFLSSLEQPVVLDADALNILSDFPNQLHLIPKNSILTPHPKEFERMFGKSSDHYQRLMLQMVKAVELGIYIILKGANTAIACPDGKIYFNSTGNPGMATAGSGDVLTGIITSLMSQGYSSFESVMTGVYLHGLAGNLAASELSKPFIIASDIINGLSKAFFEIENLRDEI
jgi:ADP-dependent NAD(P)H-hydrate dehydratase / NAD(P)H-hydrate epimerase